MDDSPTDKNRKEYALQDATRQERTTSASGMSRREMLKAGLAGGLALGGVFFFELLSVILQVGSFKLRGGKRIFKCAPIHHHYHQLGWTEQKIVVRFWVISAMLVAIALATIKLR